jgi:hypothetical protein
MPVTAAAGSSDLSYSMAGVVIRHFTAYFQVNSGQPWPAAAMQ